MRILPTFTRISILGLTSFSLAVIGITWSTPSSYFHPGRVRKVASVFNPLEDATVSKSNLVLHFSSSVDAAAFSISDLVFSRSTDRLGSGPRDQAQITPTTDPTRIEIALNEGWSFNLSGTYTPAQAAPNPGNSPSLIRLRSCAFDPESKIASDCWVPVLVDERFRTSFQGDRFEDSSRYKPYFGHLHSHTSLSDGKLLPTDAYALARKNGLDFFAVTDHLEYLDSAPSKWKRLKKMAEDATLPGQFVALAAYEWGGFPSDDGWMNHVNLLGTHTLLDLGKTDSLRGLYSQVRKLPSPTIAVFNHPGFKRFGGYGVNNWEHFSYDAGADVRFNLIRVEPETGPHNEQVGYIPALDQGWHLAPEVDEDNHTATWGDGKQRTGIWSPGLSEMEIWITLKRRATFFTSRPKSSVKLVGDHRWLMGSTLYGDGSHALDVTVNDDTVDAAAPIAGTLELVTVGGKIEEEVPIQIPGHVSLTVDPSQDAYYYVRVRETSGVHPGPVTLISAPLFIRR